MFQKVLIANRGEVAVRIIRALREMKITSVAVYSTADKNSLHTELADEAICIGPPKPLDSYQNMVAVAQAAMITGCDAIHPGYGFLSENADFAKLCEEIGITFIGPKSGVIEAMGNKQHARETMHQAGVPITPGSEGLIYDVDEGLEIARELGFPVMVKAADGGGGRGMRRVNTEEDFERLFEQAAMESEKIYGNRDMYIEKIIDPARHVEVQLLADNYGNVVHLGERDCSLQRNNQKVVEFAPAWSLGEETRRKMCETARKACKNIGYTSAGTIEFLVDENENFYFMEMNTRLQVEHPISEQITGIDIVKEQIRLAAGEKLGYTQDDIEFNGYAIECRLNAEDPTKEFRPMSGYIDRLILPSGGLGLRVESGVYPQYLLPPFYDSMIAKIITHGKDPEEAFDIMQRALVEVSTAGLTTNVELLEALISNEDVKKQDFHTNWLEKEFMPKFLEEYQEAKEAEKNEE